MQSQEINFQLSDEDEEIVRTYECTTLKRWFNPPTIGYLTITNRRVVFHSTGKSLTGNSFLINEMPLDDVSSVSIYYGLSINWFLFIGLTGLAYFATQTIAGLLSFLFDSYWIAIILIIPYLTIWILNGNILNEEIKERIFGFLDNLFQGRIEVSRDLSQYLPYTRIPLYIGIAIFGWRLASTSTFGLGTPLLAWGILLAIYAYIIFNLVGRRNSFSMQIGSKTMKDSGIYIPGDSFNLLPGQASTALQGLGARPAKDADKVAMEIGAMLLDMKQLGDLAVEKWKQ